MDKRIADAHGNHYHGWSKARLLGLFSSGGRMAFFAGQWWVTDLYWIAPKSILDGLDWSNMLGEPADFMAATEGPREARSFTRAGNLLWPGSKIIGFEDAMLRLIEPAVASERSWECTARYVDADIDELPAVIVRADNDEEAAVSVAFLDLLAGTRGIKSNYSKGSGVANLRAKRVIIRGDSPVKPMSVWSVDSYTHAQEGQKYYETLRGIVMPVRITK